MRELARTGAGMRFLETISGDLPSEYDVAGFELGFESPHPRFVLTLLDQLQFLSQLHHAAVGQHATEIYAGVNHAVAADDGAGIDY